MRMSAIGFALVLGGCSSLIANFEDDRVGARPSISPAGYPDDEIRFNTTFQGRVRGYPIADPTGVRSGRQSLELIGNSSVSFRSEPVPAPQQTGRHTVSFLFTDETARGKTISFSQGNGAIVRFRISDDTLTISGADGADEQQFSITTLGAAALVTLIIDPATGVTRVSWRSRSESVTWSTTFASPGEGRVPQFTLQFGMDDGGEFARGRISIDDVNARWTPRISFGTVG